MDHLFDTDLDDTDIEFFDFDDLDEYEANATVAAREAVYGLPARPGTIRR